MTFNKVSLSRFMVNVDKMDIEGAKDNLEKFRKKYPSQEVYEVSAIMGQGFDSLIIRLADIVDSTETVKLYKDEEYASHVLYKFKEEKPFTISKDKDVFVIRGEVL